MAEAIANANGIDLNKSSEDELDRVSGLGRERAHRLVEGRPFKSWEDIRRVEGFSDKMIDDLRRAGAVLGTAR